MAATGAATATLTGATAGFLAGSPAAILLRSLLCFFSSCLDFHISLAMMFGNEAGSSEEVSSEDDEEEE